MGSSTLKIKIIFLAFHSTTVLSHYWQYLRGKADCQWFICSPHVYKELKALGVGDEQIYFKDMSPWLLRPRGVEKIVNKIRGVWIRKTIRYVISRSLDSIDPHIVISDTAGVLVKYAPRNPRWMKVMVFHSVCYKKYYLHAVHLEYDLLLLPGGHHKARIEEYYSSLDLPQLEVVGWPRADRFVNGALSSQEKNDLVIKMGLKAGCPNVLFAPTHNAYFNRGVLPGSFGSLEEGFEEFCRRIMDLKVNLIIKMHPLSGKLINDQCLHKIADKYGAYLTYRQSSHHLDQSMENLLKITDVLIADTSGIIMDFMVLNRPIVYIEPDHPESSWDQADIPADDRAGAVAMSMDEVIESLRQALRGPDVYRAKREEVLGKIFYKLDGQSSPRAAQAVLDYYDQFRRQRQDPDFVLKRSRRIAYLRGKYAYLRGQYYD